MKKLVLALFIFIPVLSIAQGYRGKDFWIAFPKNAINEQGRNLSFTLFICAEQRTSGTIVNLATGDTQKFDLEYGSEIERDIDTVVQLDTSETLSKKSVHVTSDGDISLYVVSHRAATTDSYMAIPTDKLGTEYTLAGYDELRNGSEPFTSQAAIVGTQNNTLLTIHLSAETKFGKPKHRNIEVPIGAGETYLLQGSDTEMNNDLTGTTITSTKPIVFLTGHSCAQVPVADNFCDMLLESEPPKKDWGREFVIPTIEGKDFSIVRIIAGSDSTRVFVDGKPYTMLRKASDFCEIDTFHSPAIVSTSKPALVVQYCTSSDADPGKVGDPFMLFIVPSERFVRETTTATVLHGGWNHYLSIVLPDSALKTLKIDGAFAGLGRYPIGTEVLHEERLPPVKMTVLTLQVREGRHLVECGAPMAVYSYGFSAASRFDRSGVAYDSYGHNCGMRLEP